MGMDVYGINPKADNGDYFRANVWWWRPLWECVAYYCDDILSEKDIIEGTYNNGYEYNETTALEISDRLESLLKDGTLYKYKTTRDLYLEELPDEECKICDATGKRKEPPKVGAGKIKCNGCDGKGKKENWSKEYPFEVDFLMDFAKFCEQSGGFSIC